MREILFRGRWIVKNEWIYGDLCQEFMHDVAILPVGKNEGYAVDPETVGQYTGLKDKNGVNIFEGDIVRKHNDIAQVIYVEGCFWLLYIQHKEPLFKTMQVLHTLDNDGTPIEFLVIGNIHDNPELMEEGK